MSVGEAWLKYCRIDAITSQDPGSEFAADSEADAPAEVDQKANHVLGLAISRLRSKGLKLFVL